MKLTIQTDFDFTPTGKRSVRYVKDHKCIRGYVSGRRYMKFANAPAALAWRDNKENLLPQPWEAFR